MNRIGVDNGFGVVLFDLNIVLVGAGHTKCEIRAVCGSKEGFLR